MFQFNRSRFIKSFLYNIYSEWNKTDRNQLIDETRDSRSYSLDRFFLISVETEIQLREKEQICVWVLTVSKSCLGENDLMIITWNRKITWQFEAF